MAPPNSVLNRNPLAALVIDHKHRKFTAKAFPKFNADGLPDYDDESLSLLLHEAYRLRFICEMPQNKHLSNESQDTKIKYFLRFYDGEGYFFDTYSKASWSGLGAETSDWPPFDQQTLTDKRNDFCCRWAKPWSNFLYNRQEQLKWGPTIKDSFELLLNHTEMEVCGRKRPWHAKVNEGNGSEGKIFVKIPVSGLQDMERNLDRLFFLVVRGSSLPETDGWEDMLESIKVS